MPKWKVEFTGTVEIDADTEDDAIEKAVAKVADSVENTLMYDAETDSIQCQSCNEWIDPDNDDGVTIDDHSVCSVCNEAEAEEGEEDEDE